MAESFKTLTRDIRSNVPAVTTKVVDVLPLVAFKMLEYTISYTAGMPLKYKGLKLLVLKAETELATQVFGKGGEPFNIGVDAFINGSNAELRINNNEFFAVEFVAVRTII